MDEEHSDLLPGVLEIISRTVSAAIWSGLTTGYLTLAGSYRIARQVPDLLPGLGRAAIRASRTDEDYFYSEFQ